MATLTIRDLDDELRDRWRVRAARHGRSMEAEVRAILRDALVRPPASEGLGTRVHQRFAAVGGAELELPVAAICRSHGAVLATRNTDDFADTGLVVDPLTEP